jgi:hypothetical protein
VVEKRASDDTVCIDTVEDVPSGRNNGNRLGVHRSDLGVKLQTLSEVYERGWAMQAGPSESSRKNNPASCLVGPYGNNHLIVELEMIAGEAGEGRRSQIDCTR